MQCLHRTRPYEAEPGAATALFDHWMAFSRNEFLHGMSRRTFKKTVKQIVDDFDTLPLVNDRTKPRVGVVGEILVKFHPTANNEVVKVLEGPRLRGRGTGPDGVLHCSASPAASSSATRWDARGRRLRQDPC